MGGRRLVVLQLAKDQKWPPGKWAFDGRKNIYTPTAFLPKEERSYQVTVQPAPRMVGFIRQGTSHLSKAMVFHL